MITKLGSPHTCCSASRYIVNIWRAIHSSLILVDILLHCNQFVNDNRNWTFGLSSYIIAQQRHLYTLHSGRSPWIDVHTCCFTLHQCFITATNLELPWNLNLNTIDIVFSVSKNLSPIRFTLRSCHRPSSSDVQLERATHTEVEEKACCKERVDYQKNQCNNRTY